MTRDELRARLARLPLGHTVLLTRVEFERAFSDCGDLPDQKQVAVLVGDQLSCRVLFHRAGDVVVSFTKRQPRRAVVVTSRPTRQ